VEENRGRKVAAPFADTPVSIPTAGLPGGFYLYYATDADGRVSLPANDWPLVEATGPLLGLEEGLMVPGFSVWSSNGSIFIQPDDHSAGYSARIFDLTGRLLHVSENMRGDQQLTVPGYSGILIVRLIPETGLPIETYKLLNTP
jgi:hypothetical protein